MGERESGGRRVFRQQGLVDSLLICWRGRGGGEESERGGVEEKPRPGEEE